MALASLDLELEVFQGPFDLLLTLVLREEVDLLEVELAEVVLAYVEHLEARGELDLEATTEFLVLIAALLELKSRLMLPAEDGDGLELEPAEAAGELLARMLEYRRYRSAASFLHERLAAENGFRYREAPLPPALRRVSVEAAVKAYEPERLAEAIGGLLRSPPPIDVRHVRRPAVSIDQRLRHLRELLAEACEASEGEVVEALARLREHYAEGWRGVVLREVAGGFTLATDPIAERAARRLLARPRTPPLTQAQAECLAIVSYLQPVSRPEIARIRGVPSESAVGTLLERGLIDESGRSRFGATLYRTTELFEKLFGLSGLDALPDPSAFDPSPEEEGELRERLLRAGEQRAG